MLFVLSKMYYGVNGQYAIIEMFSNTPLLLTVKQIKALIEKGGILINAELVDDVLKLDSNEYSNINMVVLLAVLDNERYKVIKNGLYVHTISMGELIKIIEANNITNCRLVNGDIVYNKNHILELTPDKDYVTYITEQYEKYILKTSLLGLDYSFEYEIEGKAVRINRYNGKSKNVALPKFITDIGCHAFANDVIETIVLNEGLRSIGLGNFKYCDIDKLVIPESVNFIFDLELQRRYSSK